MKEETKLETPKLRGLKEARRGKNQKAIFEKNMANRQKNSPAKKEEYITVLKEVTQVVWEAFNAAKDEKSGKTTSLKQYHADWVALVELYDSERADEYLSVLSKKIYTVKYRLDKLYEQKVEISKAVEDINGLPRDKYFLLSKSEKIQHSKNKWYSSEIPKLSKSHHGDSDEGKPNLRYQIIRLTSVLNKIECEARAIGAKFPSEKASHVRDKAMEYCDNPYIDD